MCVFSALARDNASLVTKETLMVWVQYFRETAADHALDRLNQGILRPQRLEASAREVARERTDALAEAWDDRTDLTACLQRETGFREEREAQLFARLNEEQ